MFPLCCAAAVCTACHSIIPKHFFSSTLILDSGPLSEPFISAPWSTNSFLPHQSREDGDSSLFRAFRKDSPISMGRNTFGINILLIARDTVFRDVSGGFLGFGQREDPLVAIW